MTLLAAAVLAAGCTGGTRAVSGPGLAVHDSIFAMMLDSGKVSQLEKEASHIYNSPGTDSNLRGLCAAYLISAYISMDMRDSAGAYVARTEDNAGITDPKIQGRLYNAKAKYHIRYDMDYVRAMDCLREALEIYENSGDTVGQITVLDNMSSIYYIRKDTARTVEYVEKAMELARGHRSGGPRCISLMYAAQMYYAFGEYRKALGFSEGALELALADKRLRMFIPNICINKGYVHLAEQEYGLAEECYRTAGQYLEEAEKADPGIRLKTEIFYADYLRGTGQTEMSKRLYLQCLKNAGMDKDNRQRLLARLSDIYGHSSDKDSAMLYYRLYNEISDSIFNPYNEREFASRLLDSEAERYRKDMTERAARTKTIAALSAVLALIVIGIMAAVYRKKDRMYTRLVLQYRELLKEREDFRKEAIGKADGREKMEAELFRRAEHLMNTDKAYRDPELSLDTLSEKLGTNRTYISNVINKYSGMSFSNYVNSFRIKEAAEILSDTSKEVVLKALYNKVGYNSQSSFYRAFQKETGCSPMVYREKAARLDGQS